MRVQIKDSNGKLVDIDPKDLSIGERTLEAFISEFDRLKKDFERHKQEESIHAMEVRELWQSIKR